MRPAPHPCTPWLPACSWQAVSSRGCKRTIPLGMCVKSKTPQLCPESSVRPLLTQDRGAGRPLPAPPGPGTPPASPQDRERSGKPEGLAKAKSGQAWSRRPSRLWPSGGWAWAPARPPSPHASWVPPGPPAPSGTQTEPWKPCGVHAVVGALRFPGWGLAGACRLEWGCPVPPLALQKHWGGGLALEPREEARPPAALPAGRA